MGDLPDWYGQVQGVSLEASSFRSGLDADKPAAPAAGDLWLARDTKKLYVCHTAGSWDCFDASILIQGVLTLYADMVAGGYKLTGLGAPTSDNDAARKTDVDTVNAKLDDVTWSEPTRAVDTIYQNTGGKLKFISVTAFCSLTSSGGQMVGRSQIRLWIGTASPPTSVVAEGGFRSLSLTLPTGDVLGGNYAVSFIIPLNYYYRVATDITTDGNTPTLREWHEEDLL